MGAGQQMFSDMLVAYEAGAKYVIVFNFPRYPETNPYGVLNEDQFAAMKNFYDYVKAHPRNANGQTTGRAALILHKDYGWGLRQPDDRIWGLWTTPDDKSPLIWENLNKLTARYGSELDVVFDDARFNPYSKYSAVYLWNATIQ